VVRPERTIDECADAQERSPQTAFSGVVLTLAEAVLLRMSERGMSFREAAPEVGVSVATLNRVSRGKMPTLDTFYRIRAWLQVDAPGTTDRPTEPRETQ
jgi:transcriptional regulator with XRE-family HTH domain